MKKHQTLTTAILVGLTTGLGAQSAENFQPPAGADGSNDVQMEVIDKEAESELLASPSRYAGLDLGNYIQALSSSFSMKQRDYDPFARHQDPNYKPFVPVRKPGIKKLPKVEPVTPFSDVIARIKITAVMPSENTFLIDNGRTFRVGDRIPLDVGKAKHVSVHVIGIKSNSVTFRHGTTGETADRTLALTPQGFTRSSKTQDRPAGLLQEGDKTPIDARANNQISSRR